MVALARTLLRAPHFAWSALSICFSEHSRAPRWKLQMAGVNLRLENQELSFALLPSFFVQGHPGLAVSRIGRSIIVFFTASDVR